jgi:hypothetical protein
MLGILGEGAATPIPTSETINAPNRPTLGD